MNGKHILIIEDEINVASLVSKVLKEEGAIVEIAYDGLSGYELASKGEFELILLDRKLPGMSGIDLCQKLRKTDHSIKIIMLTAMVTADDIVHGLDTGADDYLTKPFNIKELLARIRSLLRRQPQVKESYNSQLQVADLILDQSSKIVTRNGVPISLTATEYNLLEYLLENKNKVLNRTEILENVWDIDFNLGTNVVDVYVNYLRKKIDKDFEPKLIQTIIGRGYMLKPDYENQK